MVLARFWYGARENPDSNVALHLVGSDWNMVQKDGLMVGEIGIIPGSKENV